MQHQFNVKHKPHPVTKWLYTAVLFNPQTWSVVSRGGIISCNSTVLTAVVQWRTLWAHTQRWQCSLTYWGVKWGLFTVLESWNPKNIQKWPTPKEKKSFFYFLYIRKSKTLTLGSTITQIVCFFLFCFFAYYFLNS